ncbi:MAG: hypothetical protein JJW03_01680, partial [Desulfosarcina sp.]|nr:hypothetical protein [Desulfobacterales bacterium]
KIVGDNISKGASYVEKLLKDNDELKHKMVREHKKPETRNYDMKSIIQSVTNKVDTEYQLNLEELQEEVGAVAKIDW